MLEIALMQLPGIEVRAVGTAEEALACLASDDISALVTDLNLPRMDGFQLIAAIRARPHGGALPIVVISGDTNPNTMERLVTLGANAYFPKPYSPSQVRHRLEELIDVA